MEDLGAWLGHRIPDADITEVFYAPADPNYLLSARIAMEAALDEIAGHAKVAPVRPAGLECSQNALKAGRGRAIVRTPEGGWKCLISGPYPSLL